MITLNDARNMIGGRAPGMVVATPKPAGGVFIVWGSIGGEIIGQFSYADASERGEALERARQRKADSKAGHGHVAWGKRIGIREVTIGPDGRERGRAIS